MSTTEDDSWFARKPWAIPVVLTLGVIFIAIDVLHFRDTFKTTCTVAFWLGLLCLMMQSRTGNKVYLWLAIAGWVLCGVTIAVRIGLKQGWW